ncbi:MAG: trypsin-like peptidase domain-containing protein [bacterium]|nr:trypsin-like peptidase domain-containing protein [bacterium]
MKIQKILVGISALLLIFGGIVSSGSFGVTWDFFEKNFRLRLPEFSAKPLEIPGSERVKVVTEESVIINVVDTVSPSVVTIGITFEPFSPFRRRSGKEEKIEQDIGSGFIVGSDGLIVTNKHVVGDTEAKYRVITNEDATYDVVKIYRDPVNDLAILKIASTGLPTIELGDSDQIKVGQLAIAIGTALGEFRHTVTTGVISGVGRGITAGSPFEGSVERLDNVIQTDAAINPGNSGGPLLNSGGQVIGVNTAVSGEGQNIGFAIPINVVKDALDNFNKTGQFNRPFLGIRYKSIAKDQAILNDIPEGAYVMEVVEGSPAETAGLEEGDIITKIEGVRLAGDDAELGKTIGQKKVGETVTLTIWRDGKERSVTVTLGNQGDE